jgi:TetR/AcrR family transcriptional repressor of nem operon
MTGLAGASIYNAFGDKRNLFRLALELYIKLHYTERTKRLEATLSPQAAIMAYINEVVRESVEDDARKGCLLVNSAMEIAPHDSEFLRIVTAAFDHLETFLKRNVDSGRADGSIGNSQSSSDMASMLLGMTIGIRVLARTVSDRSTLEGLVRPAYALLAPDPA